MPTWSRTRDRLAFLAVFVAAVVVALLTLPGVDEIRDRLGSVDALWIAVVAALSLGSRLGFGVALWGAFERHQRLRRALVLGFAEQGANVVLPSGGVGGPAFGALVMTRAGVPARLAAERHAVLFLVTSLVSFTGVVLAGSLMAAGVLPGAPSTAAALLPALGAGLILALAWFEARRPVPEVGHGGVLGMTRRITAVVHSGARTALELVLRRDAPLLLGALAYYLLDVAALAATFAAVGGPEPPVGVLLLAYTLGQAGALLPTPGGLGGTEGALIAMFVAFGSPAGAATAAVLGYRVFQLGVPMLLGALAALRIRHDPAMVRV
jgi:uncharacterized membrane protein YbhN (UPF0104 family)